MWRIWDLQVLETWVWMSEYEKKKEMANIKEMLSDLAYMCLNHRVTLIQ